MLLAPSPGLAAPGGVELSRIPRRTFAIADNNNLGTESWYLRLYVSDSLGVQWEPDLLEVALSAGAQSIGARSYGRAWLGAMKRGVSARPAPLPPIVENGIFSIPLVFSEPAGLGVDAIDAHLKVTSPGGSRLLSGHYPVERYAQRTRLRFPFRGTGQIGQGRFNEGGHEAVGELFAIDVTLVDRATLAVQRTAGDRNEDFFGWGHELVAPAAGIVVAARGDVPDQPRPGQVDTSTYVGLPEPGLAAVGNHVVVDHGNGEFSALCHLQRDSVLVSRGDRVAQLQPVGLMGNSGNSYLPHLHFQLQDGPVIYDSMPLPFLFEDARSMSRGDYFEARS